MSSEDAFLQDATASLGSALSTAPSDLAQVQADKSGKVSNTPPLAVVTPRTIADVQELMRLASRHHIPVVPRGGGSGLAGGAIGEAGEVVLSLEKLDAIEEISRTDRLARVQAGVINERLNEEAQRHGLWFTPDPASRPWSTVGGNIATNAGGLLCAKYGVTREAVLELQVVLADGRLISMGHRSVKGVTGLDLCNLMIGSEGTLGIIVAATVKLEPISPYPRWTLRADFSGLDEATGACSDIITAGITPAILELMDSVSFAHIARFMGEQLGDGVPTVVVAQTDGADAREVIEAMAEICRHRGGVVEVVPEGEDAERLLTARRSMHPAMEQHGTVLIEDVAVPRSRLTEMFQAIRQVEDSWGLEIPTVAHAADGNLHPNLIFTGESVPDEVWSAADEIFRHAIRLGGTLTGEHGIGILKRRWLRDEIGDDQWELQRDIKRVFDPLGILNPGKMFDDGTAGSR